MAPGLHLEDVVLEKWEVEDEMRFLVGLDSIKENMRLFDAHSRIQSKRKASNIVTDLTWDFTSVLVGPPGTGKRSVAKIMATLLHRRRLTNRKALLEVSVAELVSMYQGESAVKTQKKINEGRGGVVYIRDMHMLAQCGPAASESIDTMLTAMNKGTVIFFFAGEPSAIGALLQQFPNLARRIPFTFIFDSLDAHNLGSIFSIWMARENWTLTGNNIEVSTLVCGMLVNGIPDKVRELHNAHLVIALFENSRKSWEQRDGDMGVLVMDDLSESMNQILSVLSGP